MRKNYPLLASPLLGLDFTTSEVLASALTGEKLRKNLLGKINSDSLELVM